MTSIPVHPVGALIGIAIAAVIVATFYWMLHPPASRADVVAERAELFAVYLVEVPLILPQGAQMHDEDRRGYDALATAEVIAQHNGVNIRTDLMHTRQIGPAVIDLAKREGASLIVLGAYREGKYTGAPLGRAIEAIASGALCDVLIGVPGPQGRMLTIERAATSSAVPPTA